MNAGISFHCQLQRNCRELIQFSLFSKQTGNMYVCIFCEMIGLLWIHIHMAVQYYHQFLTRLILFRRWSTRKSLLYAKANHESLRDEHCREKKSMKVNVKSSIVLVFSTIKGFRAHVSRKKSHYPKDNIGVNAIIIVGQALFTPVDILGQDLS